MSHRFTLTLRCPSRSGVTHAISSFLYSHGCEVLDHQQYDDPMTHTLFVRTEFASAHESGSQQLSAAFDHLATGLGAEYSINDQTPQRILVMVSRLGHCLNDLIFRWRSGTLGGELVAVASNHADLAPMTESAGLPFHHLPVSPETKPAAENAMLDLVSSYDVDLVVLARYMQIISDETCSALRGRAINIHHSFLPGFKGAKPYHQAHQRGVKYVGATAHYVTPDLDEGPIIEQEVIRIDHTHDPRRLATVGSDAEALALSRAVRWHSEYRVLMNGTSTVVFT
ncbi:formyltetrahydrofolate deformylase [Gordonia sp. JH63]|uniref:formyltetrahydrofolate deformylase n=1 Tax=Gordonia TaxID=2053 RepID=UPI00083A4DF2|nr:MULTISPECIES: formyltetrahydrofolate deformylase [Gordonia]MCZ4534519.1 formyltetrahydrofolate deformylase [Gordonia terrae]OCW84896.1 formyltetrahydrofolate deformylase [Nocardia farcinica]MBN0973161.1 formyltetrahydrofolate deformylase [Gordonia sp. BP-119]MBN0983194.1 formyltetrahydrofolate deformylase [Gordonia sp. BP-94]QHD85010.1 formyltetrahydrofolate deformylase [Gordonia sp. JH63]